MDTSRLCHTLFGNLLCVIFVYDLSLFFHFYAFKFVRRQTKVVKKSFCSVVCVRIVSICGRGVCVLLAFPCLCSRDWNGCCRGFPYGVLYLYLSSSYLEWQVVINCSHCFLLFSSDNYSKDMSSTSFETSGNQGWFKVGFDPHGVILDTGNRRIVDQVQYFTKNLCRGYHSKQIFIFIFLFFLLYVIMSTILW